MERPAHKQWNQLDVTGIIRRRRGFNAGFAVAFFIPDVGLDFSDSLNKADLLNEWRQTEVGIMKRHSGFKMWMWWDPNGVWWSARVRPMWNRC